ncbi:MAG: fold metallo-hydrolase [Sphingomonas bacterium]|uniref:MBL fold metallo-hydrolase n=1 Tax=Sphingomonas bacterium TaxID=1895847 RepID=UPI00260A8A55|nr:MBL fold metallo-hydrolase [Sphingomonas bacterium]MDB5704526.1 fold metallo-hydrolase [Sphingomonas bacterium]
MRKRGKIALGVMAVIAIALVCVKLFQRQIGTALLARAVADRVGRDSTATLPDGLHVALCGTGSPLPDPTRAGPCNVVIAGKRIFVVDAGEGGGKNIVQMGIPPGRIEALFLTHFHSDHIDGLAQVMLLRWSGSSWQTPLPIHGPPGIESIVAGLRTAYTLDTGYRVAHHGTTILPPSGAGGLALPFTLPPAGHGDSVVLIDDGGVKITAFRVNHKPVEPAVGYRFDYKGRSVVLSGDTVPTPSLIAAAKGADVLVHEALQPNLVALLTRGLAAKGQANMAQVTRDIIGYHSTPEQAAQDAKAAGVRYLMLNHIVPPMPMRFAYPAFLGDAHRYYDGPITIGEDGMMLNLPAGSHDIVLTRLLDR